MEGRRLQTKQIYGNALNRAECVGICKTESSRNLFPAHDDLVEAPRRMAWPDAVSIAGELGVRKSGESRRWPYLAQQIMRRHILPVARTLGIRKRIGWHTFRHTYSTLLRSTGAELKIMQELLRHSTIRVTLDTYTQAVTTEKRNAQEAVVSLLFPQKTQET